MWKRVLQLKDLEKGHAKRKGANKSLLGNPTRGDAAQSQAVYPNHSTRHPSMIASSPDLGGTLE